MKKLCEFLAHHCKELYRNHTIVPRNSDFTGREQEIERIRKFLREPTARGGILLVSGPRGSGKTRLVDEALSGGCDFCAKRERRVEVRPPRMLARIIIKVDVDPNFPVGNTAANGQAQPGQADSSQPTANPAATESDTLTLLKNLTIALCSVLDPRRSVRRYGRTLRERLSFWRYWFSFTGLYRPAPGRGWKWSLLCFILTCPLGLWGTPWLVNKWLSHLSGTPRHVLPYLAPLPGALCLLVIAAVSWLLLRGYDWSALKRVAGRLYDLTHAQDMRKEDSETLQNELKAAEKAKLAAALIVAILGIIFHFSPSIPQKDILAPGTLGLAGSLLFWTSTRKRTSLSSFGQKNSVWMISQLRRYLHLLHRCGIEPVLVFDELDKFEPDRLQAFLDALLRLKHALGAEFFMILIGSAALSEKFSNDCDDKSGAGMGKLATLIRQDIAIGPIGRQTAADYLDKHEVKEGIGDGILDRAWIDGKGNYAVLHRNLTVAATDGGKSSISLSSLGRYLAEQIEPLFEPERQIDYIPACLSEPTSAERVWQDYKVLHSPGRQSWVRVGLLDLAYELLNRQMTWESFYLRMAAEKAELEGSRNRLRHGNTEPEFVMPGQLVLFGRFLLYNRLIEQYETNGHGLPRKSQVEIEGKSFGDFVVVDVPQG